MAGRQMRCFVRGGRRNWCPWRGLHGGRGGGTGGLLCPKIRVLCSRSPPVKRELQLTADFYTLNDSRLPQLDHTLPLFRVPLSAAPAGAGYRKHTLPVSHLGCSLLSRAPGDTSCALATIPQLGKVDQSVSFSTCSRDRAN